MTGFAILGEDERDRYDRYYVRATKGAARDGYVPEEERGRADSVRSRTRSQGRSDDKESGAYRTTSAKSKPMKTLPSVPLSTTSHGKGVIRRRRRGGVHSEPHGPEGRLVRSRGNRHPRNKLGSKRKGG